MKRKLQLVDSFSKRNRSCLCSWTLGLGCTAFRNSILSLFGWGWLLWAHLTGRFPMGSPTVAVLKDRVAHSFPNKFSHPCCLPHWPRPLRCKGQGQMQHLGAFPNSSFKNLHHKHGPHWTDPSVYHIASSGIECTGDAHPSLQGNCSLEHWWFSWAKIEAWLVFTVCW